MNVLVTGSAGYLASLILPRLAGDPAIDRLVGLDVRAPSSPPEKLEQLRGSVLDPNLAELFRERRIDMVLHLAWIFDPTHDREQMRTVDVDGSRTVFQAALDAGVEHLIHLSSTTAYGAHPDNPALLKESDVTRGTDAFPYSADKATVDVELARFEAAHPELGVTRLRPCIVLGAGTDNFVRAILDLPVLVRFRGFDPALQFLHETDLADAVELVVKRRPRGFYNIAPEATVRMSDLGTIRKRSQVALPGPMLNGLLSAGWATHLFRAPPGYLDFIRWRWIADVDKAKRELGFTPKRSSREAVEAIA